MINDSVLEALSPTEILGLTIIGEARGERIEGQIAVGCVIRNRMLANPSRYRSLTDVCLERLQFSCWNKNDPNRIILLELADKLASGGFLTDLRHIQCMYVARGIEIRAIMDNTNGAVNYMTKSLFDSDEAPKWSENARNTNVIGHHIFFNV